MTRNKSPETIKKDKERLDKWRDANRGKVNKQQRDRNHKKALEIEALRQELADLKAKQ